MLTVILSTMLLVTTCVVIHYQALVAFSKVRRVGVIEHQRWISLLVLGAIVSHLVEIGVFGFGYYVLDQIDGCGGLLGFNGEISSDHSYFSFVVYTSLGFGDVTPYGPIRYLAAVETLTGLILIAWTASLVFVEMQRSWNVDGDSD